MIYVSIASNEGSVNFFWLHFVTENNQTMPDNNIIHVIQYNSTTIIVVNNNYTYNPVQTKTTFL